MRPCAVRMAMRLETWNPGTRGLMWPVVLLTMRGVSGAWCSRRRSRHGSPGGGAMPPCGRRVAVGGAGFSGEQSRDVLEADGTRGCWCEPRRRPRESSRCQRRCVRRGGGQHWINPWTKGGGSTLDQPLDTADSSKRMRLEQSMEATIATTTIAAVVDAAAPDDEDDWGPCVECSSMPQEDRTEWCGEVGGFVCSNCFDICERCGKIRLAHCVTWFSESDGVTESDPHGTMGAFSACDRCWRPEDDRRGTPSSSPGSDDSVESDSDDWVESDSDIRVDMARNELFRLLSQLRRRSAGSTLVRAMRRSAFFERATYRLHAPSAIFGKQAAEKFAAEFGC